MITIITWLQKTQPTRGGAVTVVWQTLCKLCLSITPAPSMGAQLPCFFDKPIMLTRWMAGTAPHKSGRCREESRSDKYTQTSLDVRYLPQTNTG